MEENMSQEQLQSLLDHGEEVGSISLAALNEIVADLDLEDDDLTSVYEQLDRRGIELTDDGHEPVEESHYANDDVAAMTTDSLQLFLNEAGRYPLLTAAEEVELAKRIERGDRYAKDKMI